MAGPYNPNRNEKEAMSKLQIRFENSLPPQINDDGTLFYRFLKARDFDVDKAEILLRKHIAWRKAFQVDSVLDTFKPKEVFLKYTGISLIGPDKEGNAVKYSPTGNIDMKDLTNSLKMNDYMKHIMWITENDMQWLKHENAKTGRNAYQVNYIFDLNHLTFSNSTSKLAIDLFLRIINLLQDNYPERMKNMYIINAPPFCKIIISIVGTVMSCATIQKLQVHGQNGTKEAMLNVMDADVLPAFLGGNRTDPDGNPSCKTFVIQGGKVPLKYFLSKEEKRFKDMSQIKKVVVPPNAKHKFPVEVKERGSVIQWEFETKSKDIGFGLIYQESEQEVEDALPIQRFATNDGTETGSFVSRKAGTYLVVFDNSHSWINSKEVLYCVKVEKPDS